MPSSNPATASATISATPRLFAGCSSHRASACAASWPLSLSTMSSGVRKFSSTNLPRLSAMRCWFCGMIAVCGIRSPKGRRNSATTAYQSAIAPTVPASANARGHASHAWSACQATHTSSNAIMQTSRQVAVRRMRVKPLALRSSCAFAMAARSPSLPRAEKLNSPPAGETCAPPARLQSRAR